jgi:hypothetical protein
MRDGHSHSKLYEMAVALSELDEAAYDIALCLAAHTPPRLLPPPTLKEFQSLDHFRRRSPTPDWIAEGTFDDGLYLPLVERWYAPGLVLRQKGL